MELKNIQIDILTKTIAELIRENSELRSALIVMQKEAKNGEHQDSTVDNGDNDK